MTRHDIVNNMKVSFLVLFSLIILAWSPWLTKESVESVVIHTFESTQSGVIDGCGFSCDECGIQNSKKVPFGYIVDIRYACGMKDYSQGERRFVTPLRNSFVVSRY